MGVLMGALFGALEVPLQMDTMTTKQHLIYQARAMGSKSKEYDENLCCDGGHILRSYMLLRRLLTVLLNGPPFA
ncbi:hypothetical protein R1sor_008112 [Riccia sorocarpa]|uniref:Uncharacterized protein n=1 Tax=Riccia sorocarpa TaxID=122646 RepID=A0ABD3HUL6_9MARC